MRERVTVNSIALARDHREVVGKLAIADLQRLHYVLFEPSGEVEYKLSGSVDREGVAWLRLHLDAKLSLLCQRCLGPMEFREQAMRKFKLVPQGQSLGDPADEPEDFEQIHAEEDLDIAALVEDEIILTLPMVAVHEDGKCAAPQSADDGEKKSPFSSLSVLKRQ
ncbi:MAG: YceD family protein [Betaproteobacteria bacterium]